MGSTYNYRGDKFKSKFELNTAKFFSKSKIKYKYEPQSFEYFLKSRMTTCRECGSTECFESHLYTPDFYLPDFDIYLELKGKFTPPMRRKMIAVRINNPSIDLRMVFMRDNKLDKSRNTRYSDWATKNSFLFSVGFVPPGWYIKNYA